MTKDSNSPPVLPNSMGCKYASPSGKGCSRSIVRPKQFCSLHYGFDVEDHYDISENPSFAVELQREIDNKNGDWDGIVFPKGYRLPVFIDFELLAPNAKFFEARIEGINFKEKVDFSNSKFIGATLVNRCEFSQTASFEKSEFKDVVEISHVIFKSNTSFHKARFSNRAIIRAAFQSQASFNQASFEGAVIFTGWREISVSLSSTLSAVSLISAGTVFGGKQSVIVRAIGAAKAFSYRCKTFIQAVWQFAEKKFEQVKRRVFGLRRRFARHDPDVVAYKVFHGEVSLEDVVFAKPNQVVFSNVDLSRAQIIGTNLRGGQFLAVDWWQTALGRNGLYDDVKLRQTADGPYRYKRLPALEEAYRNVRAALEDNRNYVAAGDFYLGEMEALLARMPIFKRHFFSVHAWYRALSNYGTSISRAIRMLFYILLLHLLLSLQPLASGDLPLQDVRDASMRTIKIATLQTRFDEKIENLSEYQSWLDLLLRIMSPIQLALVVFAFRGTIKRH